LSVIVDVTGKKQQAGFSQSKSSTMTKYDAATKWNNQVPEAQAFKNQLLRTAIM